VTQRAAGSDIGAPGSETEKTLGNRCADGALRCAAGQPSRAVMSAVCGRENGAPRDPDCVALRHGVYEAAQRGARVGKDDGARFADCRRGEEGALGTARVLLVPWLVDGWLASPSCH
jgi:hypothetical protein